MNTNIHVNVNEIPPEVAERIGCAFLGFHKRFQQSPELMAELEAYRAIRAIKAVRAAGKRRADHRAKQKAAMQAANSQGSQAGAIDRPHPAAILSHPAAHLKPSTPSSTPPQGTVDGCPSLWRAR